MSAPVQGCAEKAFTAVHVHNTKGTPKDAAAVHILPGGVVAINGATSPNSRGIPSDVRFRVDGVFSDAGPASLPKQANPNGVHTTDLSKDPRLIELFEHLDKNEDGKVELKELTHFYRKEKLIKTAEAEREALKEINTFDLDADGCISFQELCQGLDKMSPLDAENWLVDKHGHSREARYSFDPSLGMGEALCQVMAEPCIKEMLSVNFFLLGSHVGTGKTACLFGPDPDIGESSTKYVEQGFVYQFLSHLFNAVRELKSTDSEYLVVASCFALPDGRNSKEVVDLLRPPAQRGPKCFVTLEPDSGYPLVSNLSRVALANEDEFADHWVGALQRIRVSVLPQEEGANDPCAANFFLTFDVERESKSPEGPIFSTASIRFANFRQLASVNGRFDDNSSSISNLLAKALDKAADDPKNRELRDILDDSPALKVVQSSLGGTSRSCALCFLGTEARQTEESLHQLWLLRKFDRLQNVPQPRLQTDTYLQVRQPPHVADVRG